MKKYKTCAGWEGKIEAERSGPRRSGRYSLKPPIKISKLMIMMMMIVIMMILIMMTIMIVMMIIVNQGLK